MALSIVINENGISIENIKVSPIVRKGKGRSLVSFPNDYTVLDLETTGLSPTEDEIIEIALLRIRNGLVTDKFETLVKPYIEIDDYITNLTGISNDMVRNAPSIVEVLPKVLSFIGNDIIVGHRSCFDVNFMYDKCLKHKSIVFGNDYIDTYRIAKKLYPDMGRCRLEDLREYLNVDETNSHRAMQDCICTQKCFEAMRTVATSAYSPEQLADFLNPTSSHIKFDLHTLTPESTEFDTSHPFYGRHFVFTGTLDKLSRTEAAQLVVNLGGICDNGITKKTNYLILGNNDYCKSIKDGKSNKHKKAEEYKLQGCDIEIIPESVFYDMLGDIFVQKNKQENIDIDISDIESYAYKRGTDCPNYKMTEHERKALAIVRRIISESGISGDLEIRPEKIAEDYISFVYASSDFIRIKASKTSNWFTIDSTGFTEEILNNPKYEKQINARKYHWRFSIKNVEELFEYTDLIVMSYSYVIRKPF